MHERCRNSEMATSTITMLVSPITMTEGGGPHVLLFFYLCLHCVVEVQNVKRIEAYSVLSNKSTAGNKSTAAKIH